MSAFQDDASEESYEDPVMLRLSGGSPGSTPTEGELSALEALFSTSLAKLLDTHPDRVSWLESSDPGEPLRVDFLFYPADPIEEPDAPPCRELSNRLEALLPDQAAPGDLPMRAVPGKLFAEVPELAVLTGCLLSEVDEDDEIAEWVDEEEALFQLDKNSDPLATVRNLFLPLGETLPVLSVLTFDNVEELERQGFTTLTDVLPAVRASGAGAEALRLARAGDGFSKAG
ncbi:hypothetical protein TeGR_g15293 [Tetraparma gracilis]|jgi:hypothetical protein|uniref:Uncharacterized protein n=1 Tax=Tetraparma gracilis TaxID=2962635 RepID=A0ABQ6MCI2_9STRA|nr:hypothetical protein TeGR_g15293 [Tetraparma gracilis]